MIRAVARGVTQPRIVTERATYAATRRCVCRKAFLGWWADEVDAVWLWCLALAAEQCRVTIHHAVRVGSHYHITFSCAEANLGEFLWWLNHSMSRALNELLKRHGYDAPGQLFDGRPAHVMRLMDAEAQLASLLYERVNPPTAGLSETCDGIPGVTLPPALWKIGGRDVTKPTVRFVSGPGRRRLPMAAPAELYRAFDGDLDALIHHIGKLERAAERAIRKARRGRLARSPEEVKGIHPWDEPTTDREESDGGPCFKTGLGPLARMKGAVEVRGWRSQYRKAQERWQKGEHDVTFPHGTYGMRRFHGATVAEPDPDAWVSAPGVSLEDAQAEVARGEVERDEDLVDRVREVVLDGVAEMVRDEGGPRDEGRHKEEEPDRARGEARRVGRFDDRGSGGDDGPRRLIVLRDRRPRRRRDKGPPRD